MTLKEALPVLQGIAEGKAWQYASLGEWKDGEPRHRPLQIVAAGTGIRLKPEPEPVKMVPLGPWDFPPGSAVRMPRWRDGLWSMVVEVLDDSIRYADCGKSEHITFAALQSEHFFIKRPGEDWQPCEKPAP